MADAPDPFNLLLEEVRAIRVELLTQIKEQSATLSQLQLRVEQHMARQAEVCRYSMVQREELTKRVTVIEDEIDPMRATVTKATEHHKTLFGTGPNDLGIAYKVQELDKTVTKAMEDVRSVRNWFFGAIGAVLLYWAVKLADMFGLSK